MDPEISAMSTVADAFGPLDDDARARVLTWASNKFGVSLAPPKREAAVRPSEKGGEPAAPGAHPTFADLFSAAGPSAENEKALVAGYWLQVVGDKPSFDAAAANKLLTNLGHSSANITVALARVIATKPQLVLQVAKSGKTKQARKTYKLTVAGIKKVEDMISKGDSSGE